MKHLPIIESMQHSAIRNYISPGLDSFLVGHAEGKGAVRLFHNTREQNFFITPHSHRFDFACLVLLGWVENTIYSVDPFGSEYAVSEYFKATKALGPTLEVSKYSALSTKYQMQSWYTMAFEEIHSIKFSAGAKVLFFEGAFKTERSFVLQPFSNGRVIETFAVNPWMYKE